MINYHNNPVTNVGRDPYASIVKDEDKNLRPLSIGVCCSSRKAVLLGDSLAYSKQKCQHPSKGSCWLGPCRLVFLQN